MSKLELHFYGLNVLQWLTIIDFHDGTMFIDVNDAIRCAEIYKAEYKTVKETFPNSKRHIHLMTAFVVLVTVHQRTKNI